MPNREIPLEELAAAMPLSRAYCEPECAHTVMDTDLVYAAARLLIREGWVPPESAMAEAIDVSNPVPPSMRPKKERPKAGDWVQVPLRGEMTTGIIKDEHVSYGVKVYDDEGYPEYHIWGCNLVKPVPAPAETRGDFRPEETEPPKSDSESLPRIGERVYATYGAGLGTVGVIWDDGTTTTEWNSPYVARWPQKCREPAKKPVPAPADEHGDEEILQKTLTWARACEQATDLPGIELMHRSAEGLYATVRKYRPVSEPTPAKKQGRVWPDEYAPMSEPDTSEEQD